jgi:hypothetical protein
VLQNQLSASIRLVALLDADGSREQKRIGQPGQCRPLPSPRTRPRNADSGTRTALLTLISCAYCSGWWVSGVLLATWLLVSGQFDDGPLLVHAVEWLAVAGADDTEPPEATADTLIHGRRASAPHRM